MTGRRATIEDFAAYFGLAIEPVSDLPDKAAGMLDPHPDPRYIAVNINLPPCEQAFSIAHEIGHCIRAHQRHRRRFHNWLLDQKCTSRAGRLLVRQLRALVARSVTTEWEADAIAVNILLKLGLSDELKDYLERHPEKTSMFLYVCMSHWVKHPLRSLERLLLHFSPAAAG